MGALIGRDIAHQGWKITHQKQKRHIEEPMAGSHFPVAAITEEEIHRHERRRNWEVEDATGDQGGHETIGEVSFERSRVDLEKSGEPTANRRKGNEKADRHRKRDREIQKEIPPIHGYGNIFRTHLNGRARFFFRKKKPIEAKRNQNPFLA